MIILPYLHNALCTTTSNQPLPLLYPMWLHPLPQTSTIHPYPTLYIYTTHYSTPLSSCPKTTLYVHHTPHHVGSTVSSPHSLPYNSTPCGLHCLLTPHPIYPITHYTMWAPLSPYPTPYIPYNTLHHVGSTVSLPHTLYTL